MEEMSIYSRMPCRPKAGPEVSGMNHIIVWISRCILVHSERILAVKLFTEFVDVLPHVFLGSQEPRKTTSEVKQNMMPIREIGSCCTNHRLCTSAYASARVNADVGYRVFALCTNFPNRGSHCIVTSLSANQYFLIKLDSVSCTHYFISNHNLRYCVQLIKIATRNKNIFEKFQYSGASNNSVRVIVTSAVMAFT